MENKNEPVKINPKEMKQISKEEAIQKMKENGVSAAYFGHDHNNNFAVIADGIELAYLETSGYGSYGLHKKDYPESEWLQGYSVMNFMEDRYTFNLYKYYDVLK